MNKRLLSLLILVLAVIMPMKLWAQEPYAVLSEDSTVLTFYYDDQKAARNGMSVTGSFSYPDYQPWHSQAEFITTAVFDASFANCTSIASTAFWLKDCSKLTTIIGIENLKTDNVMNMGGMFSGCSALTSLDVSHFNTANVIDMSSIFSGCSGLTSLDVSGFKTDNVTDMQGMFGACSSLTSLDVSNLKTDNVTNMGNMFWGCSGLTTLDLSNFNTYNVTYMWSMFGACSGLTTLDLSNLKTDNVTNMDNMFWGCSGLTTLDLSNFNTSNVTDMSGMFYNCSGLTTLDVSNFNTDNVTNMGNMFWGCSGLTTLDVSNFNTDNVTNMSDMFYDCSALTSLDLSNFNTANVTDMSGMFYNCSGLTTLDVSNFNTDNVTNMGNMFYDCSALMSLDLSHFNTANVTNMSGMFYDCSALTSLDVSKFNTANVTEMGSMFNNCFGLTNLDVGGFNTSNVTYMGFMFSDCSGLTNLDLSGFNTDNVVGMWYMFSGCSGLTNLDLSGFNTANVTYMSHMFYGCSGLKTIYVGEEWNTLAVTEGGAIFSNCTSLVGGKGTTYDANHIDYIYARIDGGPNSVTPGYFTRSGDAPYVAPEPYAVLSNDDKTVTFYYDDQRNERGGIDINNSYVSFDYHPPYATATTAVFDATFADYMPKSTAYWFYSCSSLTTIIGIENLKTDNVTDMGGMFWDCFGLTSLDVSGFNTANVTDMHQLFYSCKALTSLNVSSFNTSKVTNMWGMFAGCSSLTSLDLSNFDTSNVTEMMQIFSRCYALTSLNVGSFNTTKLNNIHGLFEYCTNLQTIDISSFNTTSVTRMTDTFRGCSSLVTIYAGNEWTTAAVRDSQYMFADSPNLVGGMGTTYDADHTDYTYAHIDGGPNNPGYFTLPLSMGDANGDGDVNIADAVATVTNILGQPAEGNFYKYAADMNNDSFIDIFDVTMIVNAVFDAATPAPAFTRGNIDHVSAEAIRLMADAHHVYMGVDQAQQYTAFQFDIDLPEGTELADVRLSGNTDHQLSFVKRGENQYRVVALSMKNEVFRPTNGHLIQLQVSNMAGEDQVKVSNMLFVTPAGKTITGISDCLNATMTNDDAIYNLQGEKLGTNKQQLGKGIYIINHKKVIIK